MKKIGEFGKKRAKRQVQCCSIQCCCLGCGIFIIGYIIYTIVSGFSDIFSNINITGSLTIVSLLGLGIIFKSNAPTSEEMMKFKNKKK